ncbi:MAG: outer-membrane lipoprotein carrier protein LolA [Desulfobulbaceae bacterium]|nr:outer-membrane lipoprotein carrier protein LolA [Candidatus Kapabacteria bacterium]MBS4001657.1 outer-membrane lipoprotein carrier protein LolA [Desulfobulbaceae bacterium]
MTKYIIILFSLFISSLGMVYAQSSADAEFKEMKRIYGNMKTVSFHFTNQDNSNINGSLIAKRGNKFSLHFGNRIIRCDGNTVWNHSKDENNIIISNFESHGDENSIETIFFSMLDNHRPVGLRSSTNSAGNKLMLLDLVSTEDPNRKIEIAYFPDSRTIAEVTLTNNYVVETWIISKLKINPEIADNTFKFESDDKIEMIDLR